MFPTNRGNPNTEPMPAETVAGPAASVPAGVIDWMYLKAFLPTAVPAFAPVIVSTIGAPYTSNPTTVNVAPESFPLEVSVTFRAIILAGLYRLIVPSWPMDSGVAAPSIARRPVTVAPVLRLRTD